MATAKTFRAIKRLASSPLRAVITGLVVLALIVLALELTNVTHFFHKRPQASKIVVTAGTPVNPKPQTASSPPSTKSPATTASPSRNSGGATDTRGIESSSTNSSQWVTSASGIITVKQPLANWTIKDGDSLVGSAKVSEVSYRLSDNAIGVIAQGTLSVVNGNFSGTLHFQSKGTGGRLDVFNTDSRGAEYNEVQINVSF